jgi:hypothetical protein
MTPAQKTAAKATMQVLMRMENMILLSLCGGIEGYVFITT